ncbi:D-alanyl-D-alanine carboxypeptidase/D-alanyl-D-alanine-endopeptidase [Niallia sp. XMNu-256]|uniref:D-alanyl-D-alanine carboxypeptidase/D-alanyl-D-alanine endopeptidase n=1 Tax=Niallia sp. XMNu-256 TaxID=3082444 RepID=UPI0030CB8CE4
MLLIASSTSFAQKTSPSFQNELDQLLQNDPLLKGSLTGISVRCASTGEILYEHNGDIRMRPASNLKLFTAAAALSVLGQNYQFKTELRTDGEIEGQILKGNLYLKGYGDPTLLKEDLTNMAKRLSHSGVTKIEGSLIGDDSWYDDVRLSPDLVWSDESAYYGSQISALTISPDKDFDSGTVLMDISPGSNIGEPAQIQLSPATNYVQVINQTLTGSPEGNTDLSVERKHGTNTVIVKGFLPIETKTEKEYISVWEPTVFVLDLFKGELEKQGIKLLGTGKPGVTPQNTDILASHTSMALSELLIPFMKLSNNGHAETLVKEMGKRRLGEGSWEKGLQVLKEELPTFGVNPTDVVIRDGSGISHVNLIPANEISQLLFHVQKEVWFPAFATSLPVAGKQNKMVGGTLRNRMKPLNVKAKTGTLSTVTSLAGYVETKDGKTVIVSILLNNLIYEAKGKEVEDRIVELIANQ